MLKEFSLSSDRIQERSSSWIGSSATMRQLNSKIQLKNRVTRSATPIAAQFNAVNNYGVKQITVEGQNLLVGAGFGFIGSKTGADNESNISSASPYSKNGIMRPFNNSPAGGSLPYNLTFRSDSQDKSKLFFNGSIGASSDNFSTVSMPMDSSRQFTYWRANNSLTLHRYDQNPFAYQHPKGSVNIGTVPSGANWGEIIGAKYTIRVNLTGNSRPMGLFFVNHPDTRNVEFSFGSVGANQKASVSGFIQVFRTDPALFAQPQLLFQSESSSYHEIGRKDSDGWSVRVGDTSGRYMNYGPYTTNVLPGNRTATFRLMLDNTTADNNRILTIDAFDAATGRTIASRNITRREFTQGSFKYQDFNLNFNATEGQRLEFRTFWHGGSYVRQDFVAVQ
jgi:hypothetical protein